MSPAEQRANQRFFEYVEAVQVRRALEQDPRATTADKLEQQAFASQRFEAFQEAFDDLCRPGRSGVPRSPRIRWLARIVTSDGRRIDA